MAARKKAKDEGGTDLLPFRKEVQRRIDWKSLGDWLWDAACKLRGSLDAPKFKDFILPLIFLKRLSDVFDDEIERLTADFGDRKTALKLATQDHKLVRFFLPPKSRWSEIATKTTGLGEHLTDALRAIARDNPKLSGVFDITDFNATAAGQRIVSDADLARVVGVLSDPDYRLGLNDVEPDILGRAYDYVLRKFAEGSGQSAGEFLTPAEVGILMARVLGPKPGQTIYDPCCGSSGLLIKTHLRLLETHGKKQPNGSYRLPSSVDPVKLFGQEKTTTSFGLAKMNSVIHDMEAEIALGDTMLRPAFTESDGGLRRFDLVTANPMWNQDFPPSVYENDTYGRFGRGIPPSASADWGWVQHMFASLNETGKMAVVLDTGAASRGSGNQGSNKERDIRRAFVEADLIEAVFLLPDNLFFNTPASGIILVINRRKKHRGEILLVNGSKQRSKGRPKNYLGDEHIRALSAPYLSWKSADGLATIIKTADAVQHDFNLSPSRYILNGGHDETPDMGETVVLLREAAEDQRKAEKALDKTLGQLGFGRTSARKERAISVRETDVGVIPADWEVVNLGDAAELMQYGTSSRCAAPSSHWPVLRIPNVTGGAVDTGDLKYLDASKSEVESYRLLSGDLLFVRTNGQQRYVGRCAVYRDNPEKALFASYLIRVRVKPDMFLPEFLQYYTETETGRSYLSGRASGAADGKFNINTQTLRAVRVPRPPLKVQEQIVRMLKVVDDNVRAESARLHALSACSAAMLNGLLNGSLDSAVNGG